MYVHTCVCMYVCTYLCVYVCTHLCVYSYTYLCVCVCKHLCVYVHTHTGMYVCLSAPSQILCDICVYVCMYVCMYIHIYIYIYIYIYTFRWCNLSARPWRFAPLRWATCREAARQNMAPKHLRMYLCWYVRDRVFRCAHVTLLCIHMCGCMSNVHAWGAWSRNKGPHACVGVH